MLNIFKIFMTALALSVSMGTSTQAWPWDDDKTQLKFVVVNNTDMYSVRDKKVLNLALQEVFRSLVINKDRSANRYTKIVILNTSFGLDPIFEGTPKELFAVGASVHSEAITIKPKANDLNVAYQWIADYMNRYDPEEVTVEIRHLGKGVHVPVGHDPSVTLTIPAALPEALPLGGIMAEDYAAAFYGYLIMPEQVKPFEDHLNGAGVRLDGEDDFERKLFTTRRTIEVMGLHKHMALFDEEAASADISSGEAQ